MTDVLAMGHKEFLTEIQILVLRWHWFLLRCCMCTCTPHRTLVTWQQLSTHAAISPY